MQYLNDFAQLWYSVIHVTEDVLVPPTMVQFLEYMNDFANIEVGTLHALFLAARWDKENLPQYLNDTKGERITLLAPIDNALLLSGISGDFLTQLETPRWSRHLQSLLKNLLVGSAYPSADLIADEGETSSVTLDTIGGNTASIRLPDIWLSLSGIDG